MLASAKLVGFIPTRDYDKARARSGDAPALLDCAARRRFATHVIASQPLPRSPRLPPITCSAEYRVFCDTLRLFGHVCRRLW